MYNVIAEVLLILIVYLNQNCLLELLSVIPVVVTKTLLWW